MNYTQFKTWLYVIDIHNGYWSYWWFHGCADEMRV